MSDGYRLPDGTKELLFNMVPTIVFAAVAAVIMFTPGPSAYDRLKDFDGLVAGALAVLAAWVTVRQMRRDDRSNDVRNDSVLRAMFRADMLRFERMYYPQAGELEDHLAHLRQLPLPALTVPSETSLAEWRELPNRFQEIAIEIITTLDKPRWRAAEDLLDGYASEKLSELRQDASNLSEQCGYLATFTRMYLTDRQDWIGLQKRSEYVADLANFCRDGLEAMLAELETLADLYKVDRRRAKNA